MKPIYNQLVNIGFRHNDLLEEYLDHYASMYEDLIRKEISDERALGLIANEINNLDIKLINKQHFYLHNKYLLMTLSGLFFAVAALFMTLNISQDPPTKAPVVITDSNIMSGFGQRMHPITKVLKLHKGVDIVAKIGTPVQAPSNGIVSEAGYDEKLGHYIEIKHDEMYSTRYHHLLKIDVEKGSKIKIGQKIGEIGSSGLSTGPHLHYEVLKNGEHVDPMPYLKA